MMAKAGTSGVSKRTAMAGCIGGVGSEEAVV
jgi:hypothetical protein